ncbi:MAG TPA: heme exporter protein CcmB [Methylomirabilota bacterium]|jgi:heme exporter protein B|nr:heme exporter protein CcmB [Methylomirabilota bacterium]
MPGGTAFLRSARAVFWKDLLVERRAKEGANALAFFAILLLFLFYFALGPDRERIRAALPGLFWLAFLLAGLLALGRSFALERENDCLDGLVLMPGDKGGIYLGKLAGTTALMWSMELAFIVATGLLYNLDLWPAIPRLLLVAFVGTVGFAAIGTLFAAMTAQLRAREVLLPVLLLPLVIPVLVASVRLTEGALGGEPWAASAAWWQLLLGFDIVFVVAGLLTFEFILEA